MYSEVVKHLKDFNFETGHSLQDAADTYSSVMSITLALLFAAFISMKIYVLDPIACHASFTFSGTNVQSYVDNYCWVEGSVAVTRDMMYNDFPSSDEEWTALAKSSKITYYPWVPLVLFSFALSSYIIYVLWGIFYRKRAGSDLHAVLELAAEAQKVVGQEREKKIEKIVNGMVDTIFKHKEYRHGKFHELRLAFFNKIGYGFWSKRFASRLNFFYLIVKILYLSNHFLVLVTIYKFLKLDSSYYFFGFKVISDIVNGRLWHDTGLFPRVTFCRVPIRHMVTVNKIQAQCALPINMLSEVVFVTLWIWHAFGIIVMTLSIMSWIYRTGSNQSQRSILRKFLLLSGAISHEEEPNSKSLRNHKIDVFASHYLQQDGIFLLRMLNNCVGVSVTSEITHSLWKKFLTIVDWKQLPRSYKTKEQNMIIDIQKMNGGGMESYMLNSDVVCIGDTTTDETRT